MSAISFWFECANVYFTWLIFILVQSAINILRHALALNPWRIFLITLIQGKCSMLGKTSSQHKILPQKTVANANFAEDWHHHHHPFFKLPFGSFVSANSFLGTWHFLAHRPDLVRRYTAVLLGTVPKCLRPLRSQSCSILIDKNTYGIILCGISQVAFEIPHKIYTKTLKDFIYNLLKFLELLNWALHTCIKLCCHGMCKMYSKLMCRNWIALELEILIWIDHLCHSIPWRK